MSYATGPKVVALITVPLLALACGGGSTVTANDTGGAAGTTSGGTSSGGSSASGGTSSGGTTSGGAAGSGGSGGSTSGGAGGTTGIPTGGGIGDDCSDTDPCRPGLACGAASTCEFAGDTPENSPCVAAGECADGLQCIGSVCLPAGEGEAGDGCQTDADCGDGLRCNLVGFSAQCQDEGSTDVSGECTTSNECFGGLACLDDPISMTKACLPAPGGLPPFGLPSSPNLECDDPSTGTVRAYFEVPGATPAGQELDFFRLPYPNDVRLSNGQIDLDGFPTPGAGLLGFDPVQLYVDAVEAESGFGANPTVLFRFSGEIDFETFRNPEPQTDPPTRPVQIWDLSDTAGDNVRSLRLRWYYSTGGGKYVCHNWFGVRNVGPLDPGGTYAFVLTNDGKAQGGGNIERSEHLTALLEPTPPSDSVLAAAHAKYAPLRSYLTAKSIDPATILNAAVVTVSDYRATMSDVADSVNTEAAPTASSWVKCDGANSSPCSQADGDRACSTATGYDTYHALVSLPIYQKGSAPYLTSGGDIDTSGPVRNEDVCMALSVPTDTMPGSGWPLVVYAHGTGGSFTSHLRDEVAGNLASAGFAVLGIDQVQHGPRRGSSTESPENLFFNFANPDAARGNPIQGAADQIALARFGATLNETVGSDTITIDPAKVVFFGHSQGSTHGSLGVPYSNVYSAAVLSGNGGGLRDSLLAKTEPVNIAAAVPFVLGDFNSQGELTGGVNHPVMTLLQHWIEPGDPINFARSIGLEPPAGVTAKSAFVTYGLNDSFSPNVTIANYIQAGGFELAASSSTANPPDDLAGDLFKTEMPVPLSNTDTVGGADITLGARQYGSSGDGHFVVFDVPEANADVVRFLEQAAAGNVPAIGE